MPEKDIGDRVKEGRTGSFLGSVLSGLKSQYRQARENSGSEKSYEGVLKTGPGQHVVVYNGKVLGNASLYRERR